MAAGACVVVRGPGESYCRAYDVFTQADYMGGGQYGSWYFKTSDGLSDDFDARTYDRGKCP